MRKIKNKVAVAMVKKRENHMKHEHGVTVAEAPDVAEEE